MPPETRSPAPIRTCVVCKVRGDRSELLRFIASGSEVIADPLKTSPGRGAWIHAVCLRPDLEPQFSRAFRKRVFTGRLVAQVYTESKAESMQTQK